MSDCWNKLRVHLIYLTTGRMNILCSCECKCAALFTKTWQFLISSPVPLPCASNCSCDSQTFNPVCGSDGVNYFTPCHAGCITETTVNGTTDKVKSLLLNFGQNKVMIRPGYFVTISWKSNCRIM